MDQKLYEKIGRQEVIIEALRGRLTELSNLVAKFVSGEDQPTNWAITNEGQLVRKAVNPPVTPSKPAKRSK